MRTDQTNIKVAVRVRPFNGGELEQNQRSIIKVMDSNTILFDPDEDDDEFFFQGTKQNFRDITKRVHKKLSMEFDRVFDTNATNIEIFEECTAPLVDSVLNGYNCSVFVYGATGAGKTFTMLGSKHFPGLAYLTMRDLFKKIEAQSEMRKFNVGVSYLEVYNEQVMNLLTKSGPLKLLEDSSGVVVSGLIPKAILNAEELLELLEKGNSNRTQHPTDANAESSRSHAIFQVHIRVTDRKTDTKRTVKLSMIDLAGSERAASTKGIGLRFREGANINRSLLALGNCINKLADGLKHIPYRDSNLTRILKDSLGGNCQTLMVANVSMSSLTYEDTYNTLKYASRAKKIRTTLRQNVLKTNMPKDFYIKKLDELMTENSRSKETIKTLEAKISIMENTSSVSSTTRTHEENEIKNWYRKMDAVYSNVIKVQEYFSAIQSKIKFKACTIKFKECAQNYCHKLALHKPLQKETLESFAAALSRLTKHIEKQMEEKNRWTKKMLDAYEDLEKLKKEIKNSKYTDTLHIYQRSKDWELKYYKLKIRNNHMANVNMEYAAEMKKIRQMLLLSCEALQKYFNAYGASSDLKPGLEELLQIMRSNMSMDNEASIILSNSDSDDTDFEDMRPAMLNGKRAHSKTPDDLCFTSTAKRQRWHSTLHLDFDTDFDTGLLEELDTISLHNSASSDVDSIFKVPKLVKKSRNFNLNETIVLPSTSKDCNKTFAIADSDSSNTSESNSLLPKQNMRISKKKAYVNSLLSENIVKPPPNKDQVKNAISGKTHLIKKSLTTSTTNKTTTISSQNAPFVRINRAASFRTKRNE